jgi:hypothetical protein
MAPPRQRQRSSYARYRYERYRAQSGHAHAPLNCKSHCTFNGSDVPHKSYDRSLDPVHRLRHRHPRPKHFLDDTGTVRPFPPSLIIPVTILTCP